jgi:hypothetical protein
VMATCLDCARAVPHQQPGLQQAGGSRWAATPAPPTAWQVYELLGHNYVEDDDAMFRCGRLSWGARWGCLVVLPQRQQRCCRVHRCTRERLTARSPARPRAARFNYSAAFLKWCLLCPGHRLDWLAGVRVKASRKLVGFISAIPAHVRVRASSLPMVEINFLCVHKKLRSKRLAPVLIKARGCGSHKPAGQGAGRPAGESGPAR